MSNYFSCNCFKRHVIYVENIKNNHFINLCLHLGIFVFQNQSVARNVIQLIKKNKPYVHEEEGDASCYFRLLTIFHIGVIRPSQIISILMESSQSPRWADDFPSMTRLPWDKLGSKCQYLHIFREIIHFE